MKADGVITHQESSEHDLPHSTCRGDPAAVGELMQLHRSSLVRYAAGLLGNQDEAEDVVQAVFVRLLKRPVPLHCSDHVHRYLLRATRNLSLNERRRQAVRSRWRERVVRTYSSPPPTPDDHLLAAELLNAMELALAELPSRRREIFELVRFHHLSYQEVASTLGVSPQTVANQMSAAVHALKRRLFSFYVRPQPG